MCATPKAGEWRDCIASLGLYEAMRTGEAALFMLDGSHPSPGWCTPRSGSIGVSDGFGRLEAYALAAVRRHSEARLGLMLANFQKFLLLSSCAVLFYANEPREKIYPIVRICIGEQSSTYCDHIMRTVKYINEIIDGLSAVGWKYRASELVLICQTILHHPR